MSDWPVLDTGLASSLTYNDTPGAIFCSLGDGATYQGCGRAPSAACRPPLPT